VRAARALRPGGVLVVVGSGVDETLDTMVVLLSEITVCGSFTYVEEFELAIDSSQPAGCASMTSRRRSSR